VWSTFLVVKFMSGVRNVLSFVLSVPAGILLLLKGITGPTEAYSWLLNYLSSSGVITDGLVLAFVTTVLSVLIFISSLGGIAVIAGGVLVWKNHVSTGRLLISLAAGVGFLWVLFLLFTLMSRGDLFSQYSVMGLTGLTLAFLALLVA
jgi:hypothetical protein